MTVGIAGNIFFSASKISQRGKTRIERFDINAIKRNKIFDAASILRGAALKVGQLFILRVVLRPPELSVILSDFRNKAEAMPLDQLREVLVSSWGKNYMKYFEIFDEIPQLQQHLGQVHKCKLKDGKFLP